MIDNTRNCLIRRLQLLLFVITDKNNKTTSPEPLKWRVRTDEQKRELYIDTQFTKAY